MDDDEDHYKVLGVSRNASKEDVKVAFRKLAMEYHPDKHVHSPKSVKDGATLRFKQISEAYEVLVDDRKRAHFNLRGFACSSYHSRSRPTRTPNSNSNYSHSRSGNGFVSKFEFAFRFLTTRAFLLNLAFAGALFGGSVIIDTSREALWKMHNPGKSFEDAMESIEKAKSLRDDT